MLSCEEATRLLSERQERVLSLGEKTSLRLHTAMCSGCREFGKQVVSLRQLIRSQTADTPKKKDNE